jgi:hypothetical protein
VWLSGVRIIPGKGADWRKIGRLKLRLSPAAVAKVRPAGIEANAGREKLNGNKDFLKGAGFGAAGRNCPHPTHRNYG